MVSSYMWLCNLRVYAIEWEAYGIAHQMNELELVFDGDLEAVGKLYAFI